MKEPIKIICCYAREDQIFLDNLKMHLIPLERQGLVEVWHDANISPGMKWEDEIRNHLNSAHIILLLVSPHFIASEYCYSKEMKRALERHMRQEAYVIPIIIRSILWKETPLAELQALPKNAEPVASWTDRDEAFKDVAEGIRHVVSNLHSQSMRIIQGVGTSSTVSIPNVSTHITAPLPPVRMPPSAQFSQRTVSYHQGPIQARQISAQSRLHLSHSLNSPIKRSLFIGVCAGALSATLTLIYLIADPNGSFWAFLILGICILSGCVVGFTTRIFAIPQLGVRVLVGCLPGCIIAAITAITWLIMGLIGRRILSVDSADAALAGGFVWIVALGVISLVAAAFIGVNK